MAFPLPALPSASSKSDLLRYYNMGLGARSQEHTAEGPVQQDAINVFTVRLHIMKDDSAAKARVSTLSHVTFIEGPGTERLLQPEGELWGELGDRVPKAIISLKNLGEDLLAGKVRGSCLVPHAPPPPPNSTRPGPGRRHCALRHVAGDAAAERGSRRQYHHHGVRHTAPRAAGPQLRHAQHCSQPRLRQGAMRLSLPWSSHPVTRVTPPLPLLPQNFPVALSDAVQGLVTRFRRKITALEEEVRRRGLAAGAWPCCAPADAGGVSSS